METSEARKRRVDNAEAKRLAAERTQAVYDATEEARDAYGEAINKARAYYDSLEGGFVDDLPYNVDARQFDPVTKPEHYAHSRIEVWDAIDAWGLNYFVGAAVKYLARYERKENPVQDLRKAIAYITKEIERREA